MTTLHTTIYVTPTTAVKAAHFVNEIQRLVTLFNETQDSFVREDVLFQLFVLLQHRGGEFMDAFPGLRAVAFQKAIQTLKFYGKTNPLLLSVVLDFLHSLDRDPG